LFAATKLIIIFSQLVLYSARSWRSIGRTAF